MSVVTTVILTCGIMEDPETDDVFPAIDFLNAYLTEQNKGTLTRLTDHFGGHKYPQINIFGGAFNYLDVEGFVEQLLKAPWHSIDDVTLLVNGEHDECAREVRLTKADGYNVEAREFTTAIDACLHRQT
jgi:hypothetical protein